MKTQVKNLKNFPKKEQHVPSQIYLHHTERQSRLCQKTNKQQTNEKMAGQMDAEKNNNWKINIILLTWQP